jgi:hypothetical protein
LPAVSLILAAAVAGCDNEHGTADKKVDKQLQLASLKSSGTVSSKPLVKDFTQLGAPTDYTEYHQAVEAAASESAATPPAQIRAKALLAHDELRAALDLSQQAAATSAVIDRLSLQVQDQLRDVQKNTADIAALQLQNPRQVSAKLKEAGDLASGANGKTAWVTTPSGDLMSQSAVDKQSAEVQSKISDIQSRITTDIGQRTELVSDADKFSEQAEAAQGDKAVELFTKGSEARKKAADLTVKIDQATVLLDRAKADLGVLQAQHKVAETAVAAYGDMDKTVGENWAGVQAAMAGIKAKSAAVLGTDDPAADPTKDKNAGNGGNTISSKLATIQVLTDQNRKTRSLALSHFNAAIGKYKEAYAVANTLKTELTGEISAPANTNKASVVAWQAEQDALSPLNYLLDQANANADLANFLGRGVEDQLTLRHLAEMVSPVLEKADLVPPKAMPSVDDTKLKEASKAVVTAFTSAAEQLQQVSDGSGPPARKNAAASMSVFTNYSWYLFDVISGAEDEKATKAHMDKADAELKQLGQQGIYFNNLPAELADGAPQAPGSSPGTPAAPAAAGATPDAGGPGFGGAGAAPTAASLVGTYSGTATPVGMPDTIVQITLNLASDGTMTADFAAPSKINPTSKVDIKWSGTYVVEGTNLRLTISTINGNPPPTPAEGSEVFTIDDGGRKLTSPDGRALTRK